MAALFQRGCNPWQGRMAGRCTLLLLVVLGVAQAFYLPGLAPVTYCSSKVLAALVFKRLLVVLALVL